MGPCARLVVGVRREDFRFSVGTVVLCLMRVVAISISKDKGATSRGSILNVARKNDSLDGSTVGDGLVRVDALVGFLAIEVIRHQLGDTGMRVELLTKTI